jgi:hypothetical protein
MNEHVFSKVAYYDGRFVVSQSAVNACVAARSVSVASHLAKGNVCPIPALGNVLIALKNCWGVVGDQMISTRVEPVPERLRISGLWRASVLQFVQRGPVSQDG